MDRRLLETPQETHPVAMGAQLKAALVHIGCVGIVVGTNATGVLAPLVSCSWRDVGLAGVSYFLQTLGVMAGYHRYFSHHAFKTSRAFQFTLAWLGCAAMQNGPLWWASNHRRHHRFSDRPGDPHSPGQGGFWHAYLGWVGIDENAHPDFANVQDLARFPELSFLERYKWLPTLTTAAVCGLAFGWSGLAWGFGVGTTLAFHAPLLVNSAGHVWGSRRFATNDASKNNVVLAVITLGEGWHNNHHHDPASARHGFAWWEIDLTYCSIWLLSKLGVVWNVRRPGERPGASGLAEAGAR